MPVKTEFVDVRVGVTGHRTFEPGSVERLKVQVKVALGRIRTRFDQWPGHRVTFTAVSPIAEGADRLVAQAVLSTPGGRLEAVLPFKDEVYLQDFESDSSKAEFRDLVAQASLVVYGPEMQEATVQDPTERNRRYEWVGRYVVDHCDVLIALWDGEASRGTGGTAEIIRYALERSEPVVYVPTNGGELIECFADDDVDEAFLATGFAGRSSQ
jgi:hypothetical protein